MGTDYQIFLSPEKDFTVSDVDVQVAINTTVVLRTLSGAWRLRGQQGYRDRTMPNGRLQLDFGNDEFGSKPSVNDLLTIKYVTTMGLAASALKIANKKVKCNAYTSITGMSLSNPSGGADERNSDLYKNIAAPSFGTFESAVTKQQYLNTVQSYPGVLDGITFAQREVNPYALEWMNLVKIVLLTSSQWTPVEKTRFLNYMRDSSMYAVRFFLEDPVPVPTTVQLAISCYSSSNPEQCKQDAIAAIQKLFAPRAGMLGFDIYRSDIHDAVLESNKGIEYVVCELPAADLIVSGRAIARPLLKLIPNTGSQLKAGTYYYAVSPQFADGTMIAPLNYETIIVPTNNTHSIQIDWAPYHNTTKYKLWGRSVSTGVGFMAEVNPPLLTFTDNGTITIVPDTVAPISTVPVRYLTLSATPNVRSNFSTRSVNRSNRL